MRNLLVELARNNETDWEYLVWSPSEMESAARAVHTATGQSVTEVWTIMQLCGDCVQQVAQTGAALAPTLWLLAIAALTAVVTTGKKSKGKGK